MKLSVNVSGAEVLSSAIRRTFEEGEWNNSENEDYKQGAKDFAEALLKVLSFWDDDMEEKKLKRILKEKGITAYRLAMECHIATPDMYMAINGKKPMFPKWRKAISEYLNVPEQELFESK